MEKIIELHNIQKTFGDMGSFSVLKDITMDIREGEFVCLVGPSGCGKSVLLYLIAGFIEKTSGTILAHGSPVVEPGVDRMMVFQDYVLFPWKNVYGNVRFGLEKSTWSDREKDELTMKYLELVGLKDFKHWHVHKLSGGMKQRVAIARALISSPKIVLMDEPFSALDAQQRKLLRKNLLDIWQRTKKTVLFVTHSVGEALYLADTIHVMTARPATIKHSYAIDIPRPRDISDPRYVELKKRIEADLAEEFKKTSSDAVNSELMESLIHAAL